MKMRAIRKLISIIFIVLLTAITFNCGSGGNPGLSGSTSKVTIAITGLKKAVRSAASVPGGVAIIKITISAPDMQTIERAVDIAGRDTIAESFDVPTGSNRRFLAVALTKDGSSSLYQGDVLSDLDETPKNIDILMAFDISGQWTISAKDALGNAGSATTLLTFRQTGNSLNLSGTISDGGILAGSGAIIGTNFQATATGSACGNAFNRDITGTVSADGRSMSGNFNLTGGCPGDPNTGTWSASKIYTPPTPGTCTYTYSDWSACQPDSTQTRTVISSSPAVCTGSPVLTQVCSYLPPTPPPTPPPLPSGFPTNIPPGDYNVSILVCVAGTCSGGSNSFTAVASDINLFAQSLLDALNAATGQSFSNDCSQAGCTCPASVITYQPWDGTSFTITDSFSITCGADTTSASIQFIISKVQLAVAKR